MSPRQAVAKLQRTGWQHRDGAWFHDLRRTSRPTIQEVVRLEAQASLAERPPKKPRGQRGPLLKALVGLLGGHRG